MKRFTKLIAALLFIMGISTNMSAQKASGEATGAGLEFFTEAKALTADEIVNGKEIAIKSANVQGKDKWMDFHGTSNPSYNMNTTFNYNNVFIVEDGSNGGIVLRRKSDNKYLGTTALVDTKEQAQELTVVHPTNCNASGSSDKLSFDYADTWYPLWDDATVSADNLDYVSPYLLRFMKVNDESNNLNANATYFNGGKGSWTVFYAVEVNDYVEELTYPFTFSDAPSDGQFAENTYWYYLKLNNKYATYNDANAYISLSSANPISYGSFWAFVKDENGDIEIYNAATGTSQVLASVQPTTDNCTTIQPSLTDKNSLADKVAKWEISLSSTDNSFFLNPDGNTSCVLNDADNKGIMAFWTAKGDGSKLIAEVADIANVITTVKENQKVITGAVGTLVAADYETFTAALERETMDGLVEALKIRDLTGSTVAFNPDIYYRLKNVKRGGVIEIDDVEGSATYKKLTAPGDINKANVNMLWKFGTIEGTENGVKLYHVNAGGYVGDPGTATLNETGAEYIKVDWGGANFGFKKNGTNDYLVQFNAEGTIGLWSEGGKGSDHAWYILPAEDIELTITDAGYATIKYPFAVELPAELTAYTGGTISDNQIVLNAVEGRIIPANSPVILAGTEGKYTLTILPENTDAALASSLQGTLLPQTIDETTTAYVLAKPVTATEIGFYKLNDTDRTIGANKAYLTLPASSSIKAFTFDFGGATGIENTEAVTEAEEYYDLQGRRVMNPTKGIYVTKSGKKVLFTK